MDTTLLMQEETNDLARASVAGNTGKGPRETVPEHELLSEIPSPTRRLWLGLCVTLAKWRRPDKIRMNFAASTSNVPITQIQLAALRLSIPNITLVD
jgi:hypothetical protein